MCRSTRMKKMLAFVLSLLFSTSLACAPLTPAQNDTKMSKTATFTFTANPLVRWTYGDNPELGQPAAQEKALSYATSDITQAIRSSLADYNIDYNSLKSVVTYTPQGCEKIDKECGNDVTCKIAVNSITATCKDNAAEALTTNTYKIELTSATVAVSNYDWRRLAVKLREKLEVKTLVFESDIVISSE